MEFLVNYIFVKFGGILFCQTVGIPFETNYFALLADFFFIHMRLRFWIDL